MRDKIDHLTKEVKREVLAQIFLHFQTWNDDIVAVEHLEFKLTMEMVGAATCLKIEGKRVKRENKQSKKDVE